MDKVRVLSLISISSLGVMSGSLIAPIESIFIQTLTNDPLLTGIIFSIGTIFLFIFSIYAGRLTLKYGKIKIALIGMIIGLIYPILYATSLNAFQYLVGKIAWAFASVSSWNMINAIFQDEIKRSKRIAEISGWKFSAQSILGSIGSLIGGYVADIYGFRAPYILIIILYIISLLIFIKVFNIKETIDKRKIKKRKIHAPIKEIFSNPYLSLRMFTEGITQSHWAIEPILFPLLIYSITQSTTLTGLVFSSMGIIAMIFLPLTGKIIDKTSPITGLKIAFLLYTIALFILAFSSTYLYILIGALLLSLGKTFNGPSISKIETENIKSYVRGEYIGYFSAYDTLTGALASLITGYLLRYLTPNQILFGFAIFTLVGFLIGYSIFTRKNKQKIYISKIIK